MLLVVVGGGGGGGVFHKVKYPMIDDSRRTAKDNNWMMVFDVSLRGGCGNVGGDGDDGGGIGGSAGPARLTNGHSFVLWALNCARMATTLPSVGLLRWPPSW